MAKKDSRVKQEIKSEQPIDEPKKEIHQTQKEIINQDITNYKLKEMDPKILAFVCNWCGYGAVESSGVTKNQYPANVEIVRVMCAGRVERKLIIDAIEKGIQGILIVSCNFGNCHYMDGNVLALQRIESTKKYLSSMGFNKDRIKYIQIRASEGNNFAKELTKFVEEIKILKN